MGFTDQWERIQRRVMLEAHAQEAPTLNSLTQAIPWNRPDKGRMKRTILTLAPEYLVLNDDGSVEVTVLGARICRNINAALEDAALCRSTH